MLQAMYLAGCHAAFGPLPHRRRYSATAAVFMQRSKVAACSFCEKAEQSALEAQAQVLGVAKPDGEWFSFHGSGRCSLHAPGEQSHRECSSCGRVYRRHGWSQSTAACPLMQTGGMRSGSVLNSLRAHRLIDGTKAVAAQREQLCLRLHRPAMAWPDDSTCIKRDTNGRIIECSFR